MLVYSVWMLDYDVVSICQQLSASHVHLVQQDC